MADGSAAAPGAPEEGLAARVAKGAAWIMAARFLVRALGLVNTIVLARLLVPADFGLVAVGVTVMQLLQNISDIGVANTVVKFRRAGRREYDALFTLSLIRGFVVAALLIALSQGAGAFYDDPRMARIFLALSAAPLAYALVNPRFFEFERALDFRREFALAAAEKIAGVVLSVAVALIWRSYWAILAGLVSGAVVKAALSWTMRPFTPRLSFAGLRTLGGFTGWMTGVSFMAALNNKLDVLFLGKLLGPGAVGAYFVGGSIGGLPSGEIAGPMARALFPGLSAVQNNPARMREGFLKGVEALAMIALPASVGLGFVSSDLVPLLLGEGWDKAAFMIAVFAPAMGVHALFSAANGYAMAQGAAGLIFARETALFFIRTPLIVGAALLYGFRGAVAASVAALLVTVVLNCALYARLSGQNPFEPFLRARRALAGVAVMSLYFLILRPHVASLDVVAPCLRLAADVSAGAAIHGGVVFSLWRVEGRPAGPEARAVRTAGALLARARLTLLRDRPRR